jgi:hypothetical protein
MYRNFAFKFLFSAAFMALFIGCPDVSAQQNAFFINTKFLRNGDLIFQEGAREKEDLAKTGGVDLTDAIAETTSGHGDINYTHVGIVCIEKDGPYVIEASTKGVRETSLSDFVAASSFEDDRPIIGIARLQDTIAISLQAAVGRAKRLIGKGYDFYFKPDNDLYYCSELVYECYLMRDGSHFFECQPMSFDDTPGHISDLWRDYFAKLGCPVPEGVTGTNPGDMSKSSKLFFLYCPL